MNSIEAIGERIDRKKGSISKPGGFWETTILPEKKLVGTNGNNLKRIKNAINAGERISDQDARIFNAFEELVDMELT